MPGNLETAYKEPKNIEARVNMHNADGFKAVLDRMSLNAHGDPCALTNPGKPTPADVKAIYTQAYYGK